MQQVWQGFLISSMAGMDVTFIVVNVVGVVKYTHTVILYTGRGTEKQGCLLKLIAALFIMLRIVSVLSEIQVVFIV